MKITAIDSKRLYSIEDVLQTVTVDKLKAVNWDSIQWRRPAQQETWKRRSLETKHPVIAEATEYLETAITEIGNVLGVRFHYPGTAWWLDEPGFTVDMHTDGHLPAAMQLYWIVPSAAFGTVFYADRTSLKHAFESIPNTGYIMLNQLNPDGSQPLQWHCMTTPVPEGYIRVTSYTTFGGYDDK